MHNSNCNQVLDVNKTRGSMFCIRVQSGVMCKLSQKFLSLNKKKDLFSLLNFQTWQKLVQSGINSCA